MFLSEIEVTPSALRDRSVQAALGRGAYGHHQLLCRVFGGAQAGKFQFRYRAGTSTASFYALSREIPDADRDGYWMRRTKRFEPVLRAGDRLIFSVRVNPTINRSGGPRTGGGKRAPRRRRDLVYEGIRREREASGRTPDRNAIAQRVGERWLDERLPGWGFDIDRAADGERPDVLCTGYRQHRFHKRGHDIAISTLDCHGIGTVVDPGRFLELLGTGLGPSKGFGCGLLLIRRE
ncbi:MAG: type I-E CRISPR-associated protein Cas6/Cse3/CasE [Myxococcota bacterium]